MPCEDEEASEVDESEEVLDAIFPSGDKPSEVVHPCEEALYLPAPVVSPQWSSVLCFSLAVAAMGRDHLHAMGSDLLVESVGVIGLVPDEPDRQLI